jgi:hypothetical protein
MAEAMRHMDDIIERAETAMRESHCGTDRQQARVFGQLTMELVAELKDLRAKYATDYAEFFRIRGELVHELATARADR